MRSIEFWLLQFREYGTLYFLKVNSSDGRSKKHRSRDVYQILVSSRTQCQSVLVLKILPNYANIVHVSIRVVCNVLHDYNISSQMEVEKFSRHLFICYGGQLPYKILHIRYPRILILDVHIVTNLV